MSGQKITGQSRALYDQLKKKEGYNKPGVIITDSYLFLMKSLQGSITIINFDVLVNANTGQPPTIIEKRLQITDRFAVRDMAVCLMKTAVTAPAVASTPAEIAVGRPSTYPNPNVFLAAGEATNLEAVYNGFMTVIIGSIVFYQALDIRRFYRVPTSQQGTAVSTVAVTGVVGRDGWDNLNFPFSPVTPNFEFSGTGNNQVSVQLPLSTVTSGTDSNNWICAIFRGFLIQNINEQVKG